MESRYPFGILTIVPMPVIVGGVLTFLLLDLTFYYWHRVNHTVPILWRLHVVHHIDPDLDVTTAYRFHVLEIALSAGFRGLQVLLIGGPVWAAIAYEVAFQLNTAFQHSNIRLPIRVERWMNLVIVTPRMHGIHHSKMKHETNANWSSVFSFWDRLHGTLQLNIPQGQIDIGIAGYARPADNRFWRALIMPFEPQRDYWSDSVKSTAGNAPTRGGTQP
jgi:sterol desaturase/sphingolipid hydroxylase (fatty acid hydroxylase superfamily)